MRTINLHHLIFHAFHGVHEEEKILGNTFIVDVSLSFQPDGNISSLEQTVNYASVYEIIKQRMQIPAALLETLSQDIIQDIRNADNRIQSISVTVEKKNPPIPGIEGSVSVTYKKDF